MNDEAAWQAHFDENPDDHQGRTVFADWLDDRDDPRAAGMRVLGQLQRAFIHGRDDSKNWLWHIHDDDEYDWHHPAVLPDAWCFVKLKIGGPILRYTQFRNRTEAENAAALAWARLTPEQQAEILSRVEVTV